MDLEKGSAHSKGTNSHKTSGSASSVNKGMNRTLSQGIDPHFQDSPVMQFMKQNSRAIVVLSLMALLGAIGAAIYAYYQQNQSQEHANAVWRFSETTLKDYRDKKLELPQLIERAKVLKFQVGNDQTLWPVLLEVGKELKEKGAPKEALELLQDAPTAVKNEPYLFYFVAQFVSVLHEDLGNYEQATALLEDLLRSPVKFLESKVYLDLGRLYLRAGNTDKAKLNLNYVIQNFPNDETSRLARLYLEQIKES